MRLLLILILTSLLGACSSGVVTTADSFNPVRSGSDIAINIAKAHYYSVPRIAQADHQQCSDALIRHGSVGEECSWQTIRKDQLVAEGSILLVQIHSNGCHVMYNTIYYKRKPLYWQTTACYNNSTKRWTYMG